MMKSDTIICYCFHYTAADIRRNVAEHGTSTILQHVLNAKRAGGCECVAKHPKGT
jgi:hypothetical protein